MMLTLPSLVVADELETRRVLYKSTKAHFSAGNFKVLNMLGAKFLSNQSRTSSGLWKLTFYYDGLSNVPNTSIKHPAYWTNLREKIQRWVKLDADRSFAHMVFVDVLIHEAWKHRGGAYAHKVKEEAWEPFYETIEEARLYLVEHEEIRHEDPQWYYHMITIAKAQGWEMKDFYGLMDEAISEHPQFYENYFNAIYYLQPRWHGSDDAIERFANFAVRKSKAHEGDGMYARIYWFAAYAEYEDELFKKSRIKWEKMKRGIDDVIKRWPDQWNINNFTYFSCLAGDKAMTQKLMSMMKGKPMEAVWEGKDFYGSCLDLANRP